MAVTTNLGRVGFVPRGEYDASATYDRLDTVTCGSAAYVVMADGVRGSLPGPDNPNYRLLVDAQKVDAVAAALAEVRDAKVDADGVGQVTPQNLQIIDAVISRNLLDASALAENTFITANGAASANAEYFTTDFIPVEPGAAYFASWRYLDARQAMSMRTIACYDREKTAIPQAGQNSWVSQPYTAPEGVYYVRFSFSNLSSFADYMFEKGSAMTEYQPSGLLKAKLKPEYLPDEADEVDLGSIPAFELVRGQNRFDPDDPDVVPAGMVLVNGTISTGGSFDNYMTTGYIPVEPGERILASYLSGDGQPGFVTMRSVAAYDAQKNAVGSAGAYSVNDRAGYRVPEGVAFIRVAWLTGTYGWNVQLEATENTLYSDYAPYAAPRYQLRAEHLPEYPGAPLHAYLPPELYVAVGRTIELYNSQVVLDAEKYRFRWQCAIGMAKGRKFSVTGVTPGSYALTLTLYDDRCRVCWRALCTIHVVAASVPARRILPIGDSLTNWKGWLQETMLLSNNRITWVGTRTSGESVDSAGNTYADGAIHHEGRSGFSAADYLADTAYTFDARYDGVNGVAAQANPFWDGQRFSLSHYLTTQTGVQMPDAVQIFLGTNDLLQGVEQAAASIAALVNRIREEYPSLPIFVCNTIYRAPQDGYGASGADAYAEGGGASAWQYDEDIKVQELMIAISASLADVPGVTFIPLATCHDSAYNFGAVETKVNPRASQTVPMPVESVHPTAQGYWQMADVMFSTYCGVLG